MTRKALAFATASAALATVGAVSAPCRAQQVYVGTSNGRDAMIAQPNDWKYVKENADGFYVNFIQMLKMDDDKCTKMAALFTHKNAFFESDSGTRAWAASPTAGSSAVRCKPRK